MTGQNSETANRKVLTYQQRTLRCCQPLDNVPCGPRLFSHTPVYPKMVQKNSHSHATGTSSEFELQFEPRHRAWIRRSRPATLHTMNRGENRTF